MRARSPDRWEEQQKTSRDTEDFERRKRAREERHAKQEERRRGSVREATKERERGNGDYEVRRRARAARHARQEDERRRGVRHGMRMPVFSLNNFPPLTRAGNGRRGAPAPRTWA